MRRAGLIALAGVFATVSATIAWACAGGGYETSWDVQSSSGILSPHNDTRSNFILLMADRYGTKVADPTQMAKGIIPFDFPYSVMLERLEPAVDPASRWTADYAEQQAQYGLSSESSDYSYSNDNIGLCHSNGEGAARFTAALKADAAVPDSEKATLIAARDVLAKACDKAGETRFALDGVASPEGKAYSNYVEGARLFYAENLSAADQEFGAVGRPKSGWLTETAAYKIGRAHV